MRAFSKWAMLLALAAAAVLCSGTMDVAPVTLSGSPSSKSTGFDEAPVVEIDPQVQLDTIQRALQRLPAPELERLGVDLDTPVSSHTERAEKLFAAWKQRQAELREAMQSMVKPAELMGNLTQQLRRPTDELSSADRVQLLRELESLLTDIDNARDFHTIGAWPTLVTQLTHTEAPAVQAAAAWAVGTAIKNSYDYQLWLLEEVPLADRAAPATAWELLAVLLEDSITATPTSAAAAASLDLQKRVLYALSAGLRGNVDLQALGRPLVPVLRRALLTPREGSAEVTRKVLALARDLLEEREFIVAELMPSLHEVAAMERPANETMPLTAQIDGTAVTVDQAKQALDSLQATALLGEDFLTDDWMKGVLDAADAALAAAPVAAPADAAHQRACLTNALFVLRSVWTQRPRAQTHVASVIEALALQVSALHGDAFAEAREAAAQLLSTLVRQ